MNLDELGRKLVAIEGRLLRMENSPRLSHAAIDDTAVEVRDSNGNLRGLLGVQADGTTAVNIVNGPPPPQPTVPTLTSVLGGVAVSWNGLFEGGATLPLDWQRLEVHASVTDGFTPAPETLQATIETPQGSTAVVVTDVPVYVRLVARSTSGTASAPSGQAGPLGPTQVVADDILDGIVTETKLANDAVTAAKIAAGAVGTTELADAAVHAQQLADAAVEVGKIADNAVTGPAISSEAVSAGKLAANAVTAVKIAANAVTAAKVAAGAITTDKLTVTGGANILTDPSFEGAYTAALVAGSTFAAQDTTKGNASPTSLRIDATSATAAYRSVALTSVATLPGEQWHLAADYWVSTDWVGAEVSIHARWETATGAVVSYSKVLTTTPVREGWTRLAGTVTAPAGTLRIVPRVESGSATAGTVWFDNAVVRPVLGGTQIQDGAITTEKVVAEAIQAGNIAAGAVQAGKIAAGAVTTEKLDALAVTSDKIAANAITVGKLAAGAVDATALAADAITGKTITGGTITGALVQTAETGQRITLNEADANEILVYDSTGTAIGELSPQGLLVRGTGGAILWLDPNDAFPNLRLTNDTRTNSAVINVSSDNAVLGMNSGTFLVGAESWKWRTMLGMHNSGSENWTTERVRADGTPDFDGGRILLTPTSASFGYRNSLDTSKEAYLYLAQGIAQLIQCRLEVLPAAGTLSALYVSPASGHTGNLVRVRLDGADKFVVDADGNTSIDGVLTAGNIITGTTTITPSAAHTPTSASVSFPALKGTTFRGYATASTTVPGVRSPVGAAGVTGVGVSSVTSTGMLVWVNRENTTATNVNWMVIAS